MTNTVAGSALVVKTNATVAILPPGVIAPGSSLF